MPLLGVISLAGALFNVRVYGKCIVFDQHQQEVRTEDHVDLAGESFNV